MKMSCQSRTTGHLSCYAQNLMQKILSPLCGINREIGFVARSKNDPKIITSGGDLTGIHHKLKRKDPGRGGYHIGGTGNFYEESIIKNLGESFERYSQLISENILRLTKLFCSYSEMVNRNEPFLSKEYLHFYLEEQYGENFPFRKFSEDAPITWIQVPSIINKDHIWVPMQLLFIGYNLQKNEPWLTTSVTTGTAVHCTPLLALKGALLELIQIDATIGHWYTNSVAYEIELDERTKIFKSYLKRTLVDQKQAPSFYWLPNHDLPGFTTACVFKNESGGLPVVAVGLGCDTTLNGSLHKSFLEGCGVMGLARLNILRTKIKDHSKLYDLDQNVALYGLGHYNEIIQKKFSSQTIKAHTLPKDLSHDDHSSVQQILNAFKRTNKELVYIDMKSVESEQLGLYAARAWSPDLLSLCLPSCIQKGNKRFKDYGGVQHEYPHPYP